LVIVKQYAHTYNGNGHDSYTRENTTEQEINVTAVTPKRRRSANSRYLAKPLSLRLRDQPKNRARVLEPWLKLANLVRPNLSPGEPSRQALSAFVGDFRRSFSGELKRLEDAPFGGSEVAPLNSPISEIVMLLGIHQAVCALSGLPPEDPKWLANPGPAWLYRLSRTAAEVFEALSGGQEKTAAQLVPVDFEACTDGRVRARFQVTQTLLEAIDGSETERFARCSVCNNFFYARRLTGGEMACSEQCQVVRRVRAWRKHERERLARAKRLLKAGKSVTETAVALGVSLKKARRYVTAARREGV
jgi:hypothetical protein